MSTNQVFAITAVAIIAIFIGALFMFGLPQTVLEWVITDGALAITLYIAYLAVGALKGTSKPRMR